MQFCLPFDGHPQRNGAACLDRGGHRHCAFCSAREEGERCRLRVYLPPAPFQLEWGVMQAMDGLPPSFGGRTEVGVHYNLPPNPLPVGIGSDVVSERPLPLR